ncbi:MAG: hypothetical protein JOZ18_22490 [Chloroflexi bacterium]|nr:hypothetical protein [Chloroflexota bacterium]
MTRKDSEKDPERPHYYSQFWLDVAAGRRVIGTPKTGDDEIAETETAEPSISRKVGRADEQEDFSRPIVSTDGRADTIAHPVAEPVAAPEEYIEPEAEDMDLAADEVDDLDLQDMAIEDTDIPDVDLSPIDEEEEDDFFDEEDEDEEDDIGWGGRGRKKPKPSRPVKPPTKKPGRRDTRRGGY